MAHTYSSILIHCVFSTKERRKSIPLELQPELWRHLGGIARSCRMKALAGVVSRTMPTLLLSLPATLAIARAVQLIKGPSSKWMHEVCHHKQFEWQEGYGAFSIGVAQRDATVAYICHQAEHHRRRDFKAEFLAFLKKHHVDYDPRYIWE